MADISTLKQYAGLFGKGLVLHMAPAITGGMVNRLFHHWNIGVNVVNQKVRDNSSLWDELDAAQRAELKDLASRVGNLDFITAKVIILGIKKDFPAVASLFSGCPEAGEWLDRQIEELKVGVTQT